MKYYKKIISIICLFLITATCTETTATLPQAFATKKVTLSCKKADVGIGGSVKITLKNVSSSFAVAWKIDKKKVIKIVKATRKGNVAVAVIKGMSKGKTVLAAVCKSGNGKKVKKYKCKISVKEIAYKPDEKAEAIPIIAKTTETATTDIPVCTMEPDKGTDSDIGPVSTCLPEVTPKKVYEATEKPAGTEEPFDILKNGMVEIPLRDEFRKTDSAGGFLKGPDGKFVPKDGYENMNSRALFDKEKGIVYCETANNIIFYIPEQFNVNVGDEIEFEVKGIYDYASDSDKGFRMWLVDTVGKDPGQNVSSGDPITTSEQIVFTQANGELKINAANEFIIKKTLISRVNEADIEKGARSNGVSTAITIKASSWDGLLGNLKVTSFKVAVKSKN